jgi:hypothetical protein
VRTFELKFRLGIRANSNIDLPSSAKPSQAGSRSLSELLFDPGKIPMAWAILWGKIADPGTVTQFKGLVERVILAARHAT